MPERDNPVAAPKTARRFRARSMASALAVAAAKTAPRGGGGARYSRLQVWLHWAIAALVLLQMTVNEAVRAAFQRRIGEGGEAGLEVMAGVHIVAGLAVLALTAGRLALRLRIGAPPPPLGGPRLFEWMGLLAHWGLYALLLVMALSGAAAWFLASPFAATLHETVRLALVALVAAHVLGALVEHYVFGNRVIRRMRLR